MNYTFIRKGAPAQINIPSKIREELFQKLESHSDKSPIDTALFHTAQMEIYKIMNTDIFPRFKNSKLGRGLMFSRGTTKKLVLNTQAAFTATKF